MKNNTKDMVILSLFSAIILIMTFTPLGYIPWITKFTLIQIPVIVGSVTLGPKKGAFLGFVFGATSLLHNSLYPGATSYLFVPWYSLMPGVKTSWLSLITCFLPRILVGIVPYYTAKFLKHRSKTFNLGVMWAIGIILFHLVMRIMKGRLVGIYFTIGMHVAMLVFALLVFILTRNKRGNLTYAVTGAVGAFTNTLFFLICTWLIFGGEGVIHTKAGDVAITDFLMTIGTVNGCLEIIASMICVSAILMATKKINKV